MIVFDFLIGNENPFNSNYTWGKDVFDIKFAQNREELNAAIETARPNWCFIHGIAVGECLIRLDRQEENKKIEQ